MPRVISFLKSYPSLILIIVLAGCVNNANKTDGKGDTPDFFQNVIFIVSDDHSSKVAGCYGNEIVNTPNLDRLASEGILFTNAYSNSPICSASRQSLITGKYPHATGVNLLFSPFNDTGNITIAEHLQQYGFETALLGKSHFNNWIWQGLYKDGLPNHGFELLDDLQGYRKILQENPMPHIPDSMETWDRTKAAGNVAYLKNARILPAPCYDEYCDGTYLARTANAFIAENKDHRFCLWLAFHEPHAPFAFPIEYRGKYKPEDMPLPSGSTEDDPWVPLQFKDLTEDERRGIIASYYTSVEYMDKNVGLVLDGLKEMGLDDETLVIYLGDQGYLLNEHKRFEKHTMWAESVKAPLIIGGGKRLGHGIKTNALVEFVDLVPTVFQALNVDPLDDVQGQAFYSSLKDEVIEHRDYVFSEYLEDNMAMVATKEWKYIFTTAKRDLGLDYQTGNPPTGIFHRLYNLQDDPTESTNLAYQQEHSEALREMQNKMLEVFITTHPDADQVPDAFSATGKLVWFCESRDVGAEYGGIPLRVFEKEWE